MTSWRLAAIRDLNESDPLPGLGELKPRESPPAPAPKSTETQGVHVGADGKMYTNLPDPTVQPPADPAVPVWPFPHTPKPREPAALTVPEGAMWRGNVATHMFYRWHEGRAQAYNTARTAGWFDATHWARCEFDLAHLFTPIAPPPTERAP